jgi:hypothetical protein
MHYDLNVPETYVRDEIRKHNQRYTDRMEKQPNILTKNHEKRQDFTQTKKTSTKPKRLIDAIL